ncbi:MAG: SURF1 family protein [SAR86 cluster bacterium]|jgi:surfeit locus 1 family protein|uniref:SURF1-like protein n=1 Tax=SAR86 cluster bacterium TaxID=2030880 RepID=A0A520MWX7_9GAMM|nr:MAG: SURF1 family protein [SAR86 cluster bacterium]|tara:strand:- start:765 stop:1466 length:702 start_codon:yes stop_codon:yes gene_type:complete
MKKNRFNPGIRITIFFIFFALLFFSLGVWQIERGQSKMKILNEFEENLKKMPEYLNEQSGKWDRVYVEGKWDNSEQILIDNSVNRGVAGYKVLTPFRINETNKIILIDRGWIKQNKYRNELPNIEITTLNETVSGILELPELGLVLSDDLVSKEWPKISQSKNLEVLSKEYDESIYPFILLADPILKNSLEYIKIVPTNMTPIKHYGYSAQWFLMFIVLCFMYIWYGYRRNAK